MCNTRATEFQLKQNILEQKPLSSPMIIRITFSIIHKKSNRKVLKNIILVILFQQIWCSEQLYNYDNMLLKR